MKQAWLLAGFCFGFPALFVGLLAGDLTYWPHLRACILIVVNLAAFATFCFAVASILHAIEKGRAKP